MAKRIGAVEKLLITLFGKNMRLRYKRMMLFFVMLFVAIYFIFVFNWEVTTKKGKIGGTPVDIKDLRKDK